MAKALGWTQRRRVVRRTASFLAAVVALLWPAASPAQELCQRVADGLRSAPPARSLWYSSVETLAKQPDAAIQLSPLRNVPEDQLAGVLEKEFHASPGLLAEMARFILYPAQHQLGRFGQSE